MKKIITSLFVMVLGVFLLSSVNVKAEGPLVETVPGASIRTEGEQGLRFYAKLLVELDQVEEHGFYAVYGKATIADLQAAIAAAEGDVSINGKTAKKVIVPGVTSEGEFSVVLFGIPEEGYMDGLSVIPYAIAKGKTEIEFVEPVTRSIGQVALAMKAENPEIVLPESIENVITKIKEANYVRVGFVSGKLEIAKGIEGVDPADYEFYLNPTNITFPNAPTKEYHTFSHYKLGEHTYTAGEQVTVIEALYGTYELVYTYDLENIQTIRTKVKGDGVEFTGVVTGVQYRDGVAKGTVRTLVVSDNTAAIHIYNPTVSSDVAIGDLVHISGLIDVYNNLFQVGEGGTVTILSNDNDLPNETVLSSIADLDESKQGYRINVENLEIVSISGDNVTVSDGINSVNVYFDPKHDVPELNPGLSVGDRVNLNNIHVGWHFNLQLAPYHVGDISIRVLTNQEKVAYAVGNYVLLHNNKQFNMGTELNLPTADLLHGAAIVWSENSNIVDGKFIDVTEDKEFTLMGIMTVEDATQEIELTLTIKYVDPSGPVFEEAIIHQSDFGETDGWGAYGERTNQAIEHGEEDPNPSGNSSWDLNGGNVNNAGWDYIRMGGKAASTKEGLQVYLKTNFTFDIAITKITIEVIALDSASGNEKIHLQSSTNGTSWITIDSKEITKIGDLTFEALNIAANNYLRFVFERGSTSSNKGTDVKKVTFTGNVEVKTVEQKVIEAKDDLEITYSGVDTHESVTGNLTLPIIGLHDVQVSWESDNASIVSTSGVVTRPEIDTSVTLTATLELNGESTTKVFIVHVIAKGDLIERNIEYIFSSKAWQTEGDINNWTSGKDGLDFMNNRGIQVSTGASGANGTSEILKNITSIEIMYSTNASSGAGKIVTKIGDVTVQEFTVSTNGGTTTRSAEEISVANLSGAINITVTCTTNSIYIYSIKVKYLGE